MSSRRTDVEKAACAVGRRFDAPRGVLKDGTAHRDRVKRCHRGRDIFHLVSRVFIISSVCTVNTYMCCAIRPSSEVPTKKGI